jgi:ferredoxin-NADP reductase/DMSO/TMAO reductase YedYZ heme-binding membrane subunit
MPTSSGPFVDGRFLKHFVIACALVPAALLVWDAKHGQLGVNEVNFAIRTTGLLGLIFLVASLAITPLRRLTGWNILISIRRNLGVFGCLYIAAHFAIFFIWDRDLSIGSTLTEIVERVYLWFGFGALVLMIPLAVTSTDAMVSRLGARRWKLLHRLAYAAAIGGVVHYYLLVKADTTQPFLFAVALGGLLLYRVVAHYVDLRRELVTTKAKLVAAKSAAPAKKKFWSGELAIARIFDETPDVKTFRLVSPDGGPLPFDHIAGQYINLHLTIDGKRVNRSYTIASSPTRAAYCEISVKRAPDGYGSKHLHETWREGQRVKVSAPAGKFHFSGHESERIVLVAGGIGITPMMSVVRSLTDRAWPGQIYLLFSVRQSTDVVFRDELAYLQARFPNLHVEIIDTSQRGHITREIIERFVPGLTKGPVMLCGPDRMMTAMRELLVGMGVPDAEIHQEAFISPKPVADELAAEATEVIDESAERSVTFARGGQHVGVTNGLTVLECAEEAGVDLPFECRSGICGQCKCTLVTGRVVMETQDALTAADRAKGLILACQARPVNDIVVDG